MRRDGSRALFLRASEEVLSTARALPGPPYRPAPNPVLDAAQREAIRARRLALRQLGSVEFCHHVLDLGVVLEGVRAQVLAVAGLLVAAVRHLRDQRDVIVDPDRPELELARGVRRAADIARPDRRGQPVRDVV